MRRSLTSSSMMKLVLFQKLVWWRRFSSSKKVCHRSKARLNLKYSSNSNQRSFCHILNHFRSSNSISHSNWSHSSVNSWSHVSTRRLGHPVSAQSRKWRSNFTSSIPTREKPCQPKSISKTCHQSFPSPLCLSSQRTVWRTLCSKTTSLSFNCFNQPCACISDTWEQSRSRERSAHWYSTHSSVSLTTSRKCERLLWTFVFTWLINRKSEPSSCSHKSCRRCRISNGKNPRLKMTPSATQTCL